MTEHEPEDGLLSEQGLGTPTQGRRAAPRRRRGLLGCVPVLLGLVLVAGLVFAGYRAIGGLFGDPDDYSGKDAYGRVQFEVRQGQGPTSVGEGLEKAGVVASEEAFTDAVEAEHVTIQPGQYVLQKKMKAAKVATLLGSGVQPLSLTLQAGKTTDEIVDLLAKATDLPKAQFVKALKAPAELGLPDYAGGEVQGYLAPGHYVLGPDDTATTILSAMVDQFETNADEAGIEDAAADLGITPGELVTVASLVQAEGRASVQSKIARVLYNRLDHPTGPTAGFLQVDATVNFALGEDPDKQTVRLTQAQIDSVADNPYNTYRHKGLPPGPIETPSLEALQAAAHPADGPWFFYVTVNLATGKTKFATTFAEQQELKAELDHYCDTKSDRC